MIPRRLAGSLRRAARALTLPRFLLAVAAASAAFYAVEMYSRAAYPYPRLIRQRDIWTQYRQPAPYTMFSAKFDKPPVRKAPGELRVFMLGGSTVKAGKPALPALVEERLKARFPGVRVLNYGVPAQVSGQEVTELLHSVVDLQPDLVVLYDGGNDVMNPLFFDPRPNHPYNYLLYERQPMWISKFSEYRAFAWFAYGSNILRQAFYQRFVQIFTDRTDLRRRVGYTSDAWRAEIARAYVRNHRKAAAICGAFGTRYMGFFQPVYHYGPWARSRDGGGVVAFWDGREVSRTEHALGVRRYVREEMKSLPAGFPLHDISDIFYNRQGAFTDYIHVHPNFNPVLADEIARQVEKVLRRINP